MSTTVEPMSITQSDIAGLWLLRTKSVSDERGTVREFFRTSAFADAAVPVPDHWSQINMTWTSQGGVRGLHGEAMTKLVGVAFGDAFGVYLDTRRDSSTYGQVVTVPLTVGTQVLVPPGVCNGFQATSAPGCQYLYCFDAEWTPTMAGVSVLPIDPDLGIAWPIAVDSFDPAQLSVKDASAPRFAELS